MRFCERCNSYMRATKGGFVCSRCGRLVQGEIVEVKKMEQSAAPSVEVVNGSKVELAKVNDEVCPSCGHLEAFRSISSSSGEHAGVRQERSIERFTCVRCDHSWVKS